MQQNAIEPMCRLLNCKDVQVSIVYAFTCPRHLSLLQVIQVILDGLSNILKVLLLATVLLLLLMLLDGWT